MLISCVNEYMLMMALGEWLAIETILAFSNSGAHLFTVRRAMPLCSLMPIESKAPHLPTERMMMFSTRRLNCIPSGVKVFSESALFSAFSIVLAEYGPAGNREPWRPI